MLIDPVVLSSIIAAVTLLSQDYAKGLAGEAGKATWTSIKALFGWSSDPSVSEIPEKIAGGLTAAPEITEKLVEMLKQSPAGAASSLVQNLTVADDGKVVVAQVIHNLTM